jgi:hypothetical protein
MKSAAWYDTIWYRFIRVKVQRRGYPEFIHAYLLWCDFSPPAGREEYGAEAFIFIIGPRYVA